MKMMMTIVMTMTMTMAMKMTMKAITLSVVLFSKSLVCWSMVSKRSQTRTQPNSLIGKRINLQERHQNVFLSMRYYISAVLNTTS